MRFLVEIFKLIAIGVVTTFRTLKALLHSIIANKDNKKYFYKETKLWASDVLRFMQIKTIITGIENINLSEKYIYIANHTNLIDIPILINALQFDDINFVYRKSLQQVPVLGLALKSSPFIPIIRENAQYAMSSIEKANQALQAGSVIMFPEGTRSFTGDIGKFKRGAFLLASLSNKKIVPITVAGVEDITPKGWRIKTGKVYVHINAPVGNIPTDRTALNDFTQGLRELITVQRKELLKQKH